MSAQDLSSHLVSKQLIAPERLRGLENQARASGQPLARLLVQHGIPEAEIAAWQADAWGIPFIDLDGYQIDTALIELIPENLARRHLAVPLFKIGDRLTVAMLDPGNLAALDDLTQASRCKVEPVLTTSSSLTLALDQYYSASQGLEALMLQTERSLSALPDPSRSPEKAATEAPVIRFVNRLMLSAVHERASDIHLEPRERDMRVRLRIDGILHESLKAPKSLEPVLLTRIKVLANLDIAERRKPQDGSFKLQLEGRDIDVRVSCFPTVDGENVVLRLLDRQSVYRTLNELGFSEQIRTEFEKLILRPHGIFLVTGPTGGGKTTTLYAAMGALDTTQKNVITIEDPIEYQLPGIRQSQVNPKAGLTFANGLRSILRQDPDVILVGEIRDSETAEIAIQASMTGHLVFATLHTNDAAGALTRLVDMEIEPFLIASSVIGVLAQRLVRVLCPSCKKEAAPAADFAARYKLDRPPAHVWRSKGCKRCRQTGYRGRIGIFEFLPMTEEIRKLLLQKSDSESIRRLAVSQGMRDLCRDGIDKVLAGVTTEEEVLRAAQSA